MKTTFDFVLNFGLTAVGLANTIAMFLTEDSTKRFQFQVLGLLFFIWASVRGNSD